MPSWMWNTRATSPGRSRGHWRESKPSPRRWPGVCERASGIGSNGTRTWKRLSRPGKEAPMTTPVGELMHPGLITCPADTPLGQVAILLMRHRVHALVVTDRDGRPVGLLSDFDLLAGEWLSKDPESLEAMRRMTAGDLMSAPLNTIEGEGSAREAAERMRREGFHRLIVRDQERPVGVLSISDLVAHLAAGEPARRETVADVMSHAILVCREETPVREVARTMTEARYRSVLVLDRDGPPPGVVSGWDLLACLDGGAGGRGPPPPRRAPPPSPLSP